MYESLEWRRPGVPLAPRPRVSARKLLRRPEPAVRRRRRLPPVAVRRGHRRRCGRCRRVCRSVQRRCKRQAEALPTPRKHSSPRKPARERSRRRPISFCTGRLHTPFGTSPPGARGTRLRRTASSRADGLSVLTARRRGERQRRAQLRQQATRRRRAPRPAARAPRPPPGRPRRRAQPLTPRPACRLRSSTPRPLSPRSGKTAASAQAGAPLAPNKGETHPVLSKIVAYLRQHVLAALALVCSLLSLAGASYAAFSLPAGSVGARELKNRAITAVKLDPTSVAASVRAWANPAVGRRVARSGVEQRHSACRTAGFGEVVSWRHTRFPSNCMASVTPQRNFAPGGPGGTGTVRWLRLDLLQPPGAQLQIDGIASDGTPQVQGVNVLIVCPSPGSQKVNR